MFEAFEAFNESCKKFLEDKCFKTNKKTGKKSLTPVGVELLMFCSISLFLENSKLKKLLKERGDR